MDELTFPKMFGNYVTGMTVNDALRYKIPMGNLKVLGADTNFYIPVDYLRIELNPPVIRFRAQLSKESNYYIRKSLDDLVFCNLPQEVIKLKYAESVMEELLESVDASTLGDAGSQRLKELIDFIKVRLILIEE